MSNLLTDLLNYSTLSNPHHQLAQIDLNTVVENIKQDGELMIREKNAVVATNRLPVIEGIPFQINQLFFNLVSNALKFSKEGVDPQVMIEAAMLTEHEKTTHSLSSDTHYFKISVSDNGIGFRQEYADKIFIVFQRLNDRREYSGNGIGLSLCKKIVENHKGKIYATSQPGTGSTFIVILPQRQ